MAQITVLYGKIARVAPALKGILPCDPLKGILPSDAQESDTQSIVYLQNKKIKAWP